MKLKTAIKTLEENGYNITGNSFGCYTASKTGHSISFFQDSADTCSTFARFKQDSPSVFDLSLDDAIALGDTDIKIRKGSTYKFKTKFIRGGKNE